MALEIGVPSNAGQASYVTARQRSSAEAVSLSAQEASLSLRGSRRVLRTPKQSPSLPRKPACHCEAALFRQSSLPLRAGACPERNDSNTLRPFRELPRALHRTAF